MFHWKHLTEVCKPMHILYSLATGTFRASIMAFLFALWCIDLHLYTWIEQVKENNVM